MSEQHNTGPQHRMLRRRVAAVTCAVTLSASVVGCSANPEPQPLDEQPAAANSTPSPTPSRSPSGPPTLPPQAKGTSKKSAIAFVEHWVALMNHSASSLSTRELGRLSAASCGACSAIVGSIEGIAREQGRISGAGWSLSGVTVIPDGSMASPQVRALVAFAPRVVVESKGEKPLRFKGGRTVYTFNLTSVSGRRWRVADILGADR